AVLAAREVPRAPTDLPAPAKLPGMTFDVGEHFTITGDDETGSAKGLDWEVTWVGGERIASEQESASFLAYVTTKTGYTVGTRRAITIDGRAGYSVELHGAPPLILLVTTCGGRSIQLTGRGASQAIEAARASFHCTATGERL